MPRTTAAVKSVEIADLFNGDKLLTDIVGYKGKTLIARGTTLSPRETEWLKKKLAEGKPTIPSVKYRTNTKAFGDIVTAGGKVLVARGQVITEGALAPLLKDGFAVVDLMEANSKMFFKKQEWSGKSNIAEFNPAVNVERIELVNDEPTGKKESVRA